MYKRQIGGGYRLTKEPSEVTLWDILILAEGDLAPVSCLQENAAVCERAAACRTLPVWEDYYKPVSYTHLDVYKRQAATCTQLAIMKKGNF